MKCPDCGQYSLTYNLERNQYTCHVYNGVINAEDMPYDRSKPILRLINAMWGMVRTLESIGAW